MTSVPQPPQQQPVPQAAPAPVWARPAQVVEYRQTPELEYHQLLRGEKRYRWFKPLFAVLLATFYYFTLSTVFGVVAVFGYVAVQGGDFDFTQFETLLELDAQNPWSLAFGLGSVALMIPAVWLAMLSVGLRPFSRVWSVALRIRWRWILRPILPVIVTMALMSVLAIPLDFIFNGFSAAETPIEPVDIDVTLAIISICISLVLVPFQAGAEELVFRGLFMQTLGAWLGGVRGNGRFAQFLRGPWLVILIPSLAFGFAHIYDIWGWMSVVAMALVAAWLTWRTGGLEAAITLHVVNNLVALSFMAFGVEGETKQVAETNGTVGGILAQIIALVLYAWWVDRDFRKHDNRRTRIDWVEHKVAAPVAPPAPAAPPVAPPAPAAAPAAPAAPATPAAAPAAPGTEPNPPQAPQQ